MIPNVTREKLLEAMKNFDQELRNQSEWIGWEENKAHKYAISHENRFYPVKKVVSIATGVGVDTFSGGEEANGYAQQRGFSVVPLRENGSDQLRQKFEKGGGPQKLDSGISSEGSFRKGADHVQETHPVPLRV